MKKNISLMMAAVLLLTLTTGCRKNNVTPTESDTIPTTEATIATTQEIEQETTAPTVDVLKEAPSAFEDKPEETKASAPETAQPKETTPTTTQPSASESVVPDVWGAGEV